ncbi:MAG: protein-glutamate O-methyltransferase CheR [Colwellia sp.]|nr:protein-glutamate O-methyltransferase CheR [Colwellia sp.]
MTNVRTKDRDSAISLNNAEFNFLCTFVYDSTGIVLNEGKREMLYRRLSRIIREKKLDSFSSYCRLLKKQPEQERDFFINAITTNLTSFFREQHHFDYISQHELPRIIKNGQANNKRLRIWSSASSTGEEPYSIAITLCEAMKAVMTQWDIKILATDIDSDVLAKGQSGIYELSRIEDIPMKFKKKYFQRGDRENSSNIKVSQVLQQLITFKHLNLLHEWPMKGPFDIIFCRNVIIYFDHKTQQELFARYYELLKPGGLLMLGHSENLGQYQQYFENVGRTIFRKPL